MSLKVMRQILYFYFNDEENPLKVGKKGIEPSTAQC